MKIVITGISGMFGYDLVQNLSEEEIVGVDIKEPSFNFSGKFVNLDFTNSETTYQVVSKENPDLIIHAAAYTDVDGCESNKDKAYLVNGLGTRNMVIAASRFDSGFVYISTDYVFDGSKNIPYREDDNTNPKSEYGKSKLWGENYVKQFLQKYFIIRSAWLFGEKRNNFAQSMYESLVKGGKYAAAEDLVGSPTYTPHLAFAVSKLIRTKKFGVYHLTNSGSCSRYEFGKEMKKLINSPVKGEISRSKLSSLDLAAPRPKNSTLENYCYKLEGFDPLPHWKEALKTYIKNMDRILI
ncbi:MAG: dTDP-4-dehydrorhamnose reductase [bacterium]